MAYTVSVLLYVLCFLYYYLCFICVVHHETENHKSLRNRLRFLLYFFFIHSLYYFVSCFLSTKNTKITVHLTIDDFVRDHLIMHTLDDLFFAIAYCFAVSLILIRRHCWRLRVNLIENDGRFKRRVFVWLRFPYDSFCHITIETCEKRVIDAIICRYSMEIEKTLKARTQMHFNRKCK